MHLPGDAYQSFMRSPGCGGVGKTQLAGAYAGACMVSGWRLVAWVNAEEPGAMLGGLAAVASALGLDDGTGNAVTAGQAVRHWLETDGALCLLVFDNAVRPEDVLP